MASMNTEGLMQDGTKQIEICFLNGIYFFLILNSFLHYRISKLNQEMFLEGVGG